MADQTPLSAKEVERLIGISGLDTAKWTDAVITYTSMLDMGLTIFSVSIGTVAGWISAFLPFLSFPAYLLMMGINRLEAIKLITQRSTMSGFSTGVVIGVFGYGKYFLSDFVNRASGDGVFSDLHIYSKSAYNRGLVLGYSSATRLTSEKKSQYRDRLSEIIINDKRTRGQKVYWDNLSDRDFVFEFASAFHKAIN